jgi:hypothetical protein
LLEFERLYCGDKKQVKAPKYIGLMMYRRSSQLINIACALHKANGQLSCEVPIQVPDTEDGRFEHTDHRLIVSGRENTTKTEGFKPMSAFSILCMVYELAVKGCRSTGWVEKHLGVKGSDRVVFLGWAHFIQYCEVEMDWGLRLWDRLNPVNQFMRDTNGQVVMKGDEPVPNPDWIDLKKFNQLAWQGPTASDHPWCHYAMGAMTDLSKDLDEFNKKRDKDGKPRVSRPVGFEGRQLIIDWLDYFNESGGKGVSKKIMDKSAIDQMKRSSTVKVARDIASVVYDNDNSKLLEVAKREFGYNYVHDASDATYSAFESTLKVIRKSLSDEFQVRLWSEILPVISKLAEEFNATQLAEAEAKAN